MAGGMAFLPNSGKKKKKMSVQIWTTWDKYLVKNIDKSAIGDFAVQYITGANKYKRILKEILAADVHTSFSLHLAQQILKYCV